MKKILVLCAALLSVSACATIEESTAIGAATGAVVGGVTTGSLAGAAVGGVVGGAAGYVVGKVAGYDNMCYYEKQNGGFYKAECPADM